LAQINPTVGAFDENIQKILSFLEKAEEGDLVIFPELALCGYPPQDFLLLSSFIKACENGLNRVIEASLNKAVIIGVPRRAIGREKPLFNSAAVILNQNLLGYQDKALLPTYDVFDERRYFEPGTSFHPFTLFGKKVGVTICEDIWQHSFCVKETQYRIDPVEHYFGVDLLVNLSASPYSGDKFEKRLKVCQKVSKTLNCPLALCNQVGGNDTLIFDGRSLFVDGDQVFCAKGFEEEFFIPKEPFFKKTDRIEDLKNGLVLGIRDYFRKLQFKKACFGLSSGIDSSVVAALAVEALGSQNVLGVMMPSRFTSKEGLESGYTLAKNLNISVKEIGIEEPFSCFLNLFEEEFKGLAKDVTEENLQARIRGVILMALSNKFGYVVLGTSNKSELALGYSTLYGDMVGGLAVLSDVVKEDVYALGNQINRLKEVIPSFIMTRPPSAELKENQKDSDSLPDYKIVDRVVRLFVEEFLSEEEIVLRTGYPHFLVKQLIERIHLNEYKRRQAPPGLRVTEKSFSKGYHFPIVQGFCPKRDQQ
jgi:NAD+ synthase (glutamine-hydrolysing)